MSIQANDISTPGRLDLSGRVVAVVDDDDLFRSFLTHILTPHGVRVVGHANSDSLVAHIERQMPDCIILDYDIVHENGLFVQQLLRTQFVNLAPVVIMSADETQRTAIRAFRNGVDDFVQKRGLKLDEIENALRRVIAQREIGPAPQSAGGRSGGGAAIDHVTGLYSRAELDAKIVAIEELSRRTDATAGMVAVQFAPWRALTQQFGLLVAEKMLREFARRLSSSLTSDFLCARYTQDVLCCLMERGATEGRLAASVGALKGALTYSQNIGAAQFSSEARIAFGVRPPGGAPLGELLTELASRFDAERRANDAPARGEALALSQSSEQQAFSGAERRRSPRRRVYKRGSIAIHGGASRLPCTIRNLSEGGAGIRLDSTLATPEEFTLTLSEGDAPRRVRKRWQSNHDLGVEFLD